MQKPRKDSERAADDEDEVELISLVDLTTYDPERVFRRE